jgi:hypothetical protein
MRNKKIILFLTFLVIGFMVSGCGKKDVYMDVPAEDGKYYYQNEDLGFAATLPAEFIYYQTQRVASDDYIDIEFYLPTGDEAYKQKVPGYANLLVVRAYEKEAWDKVNHDEATAIYKKFGETKDRVLAAKIVDSVPSDWEDRWTEDLQNNIRENLSIIK